MSTKTHKRFSVTLPPKMAEKVEQIARNEERTFTEITQEAMRQYLKSREAAPA